MAAVIRSGWARGERRGREEQGMAVDGGERRNKITINLLGDIVRSSERLMVYRIECYDIVYVMWQRRGCVVRSGEQGGEC